MFEPEWEKRYVGKQEEKKSRKKALILLILLLAIIGGWYFGNNGIFTKKINDDVALNTEEDAIPYWGVTTPPLDELNSMASEAPQLALASAPSTGTKVTGKAKTTSKPRTSGNGTGTGTGSGTGSNGGNGTGTGTGGTTPVTNPTGDTITPAGNDDSTNGGNSGHGGSSSHHDDGDGNGGGDNGGGDNGGGNNGGGDNGGGNNGGGGGTSSAPLVDVKLGSNDVNVEALGIHVIKGKDTPDDGNTLLHVNVGSDGISLNLLGTKIPILK